MTDSATYPIGVPGEPWGASEKAQWLACQAVKRSYANDVLSKTELLKQRFVAEQYGALSIDSARYPLLALKSRAWKAGMPVALVTGGVHGYETSGVHGALRFLETAAQQFETTFNIVAAPCVSPWSYETINRWNPAAIDPNRSFRAGSGCEEAAALMRLVAGFADDVAVHIDLHETTDTDNSEFRPALAARDGTRKSVWMIPDGFYLVGNEEKPAPDFQKAIIASVEKVTHIAAPDEQGKIIGKVPTQRGVINYSARPLGLCMGMTGGYVTTTEVYPDSERVDDDNCVDAQVAAVVGGLSYVANER